MIFQVWPQVGKFIIGQKLLDDDPNHQDYEFKNEQLLKQSNILCFIYTMRTIM